jgi:hypothetical protein
MQKFYKRNFPNAVWSVRNTYILYVNVYCVHTHMNFVYVLYPSVSVFMNIELWLKSWHLVEKPVFPHKHCRDGICTNHPKKLKQT